MTNTNLFYQSGEEAQMVIFADSPPQALDEAVEALPTPIPSP